MVSNIKIFTFSVKIFFCYKNQRSRYEVEKVAIWQLFLISGKPRAWPFLIFVFCPCQIKNYIITGLVSNFLMHLVRGWHFLFRKENIITQRTYIESIKRRPTIAICKKLTIPDHAPCKRVTSSYQKRKYHKFWCENLEIVLFLNMKCCFCFKI